MIVALKTNCDDYYYKNTSNSSYGHDSLMKMEKRQLFLRSYQFSRKRSVGERLKRSLVRIKRLFLIKLRSARKIRRLVWSCLRYALFYRRRRRFLRLLHIQTLDHDHQNPSFPFY
ncbi:hypothetical protein K2173_003941 [Erythroxylum novogranatense]|uniref:Ribosomal protein S14 n=1 Tax=Erythroxylum novogranatense TaxID=1862640 RepID=A0AAV8SJA1_9ROSI|nr:hypothetical protein K2173_003941 [Erythroxylum novogranatense]